MYLVKSYWRRLCLSKINQDYMYTVQFPSGGVNVGELSFLALLCSYGEFKELCLRMFPQASSFICVVEVNTTVELSTSTSNSSRARLQTEHRVYSRLCRELIDFVGEHCVSDTVFASGTDNYSQESIKNTLESRDRLGYSASYWSSKGTINPGDPETLIFKLGSRLSLITEIHIHPFQGSTGGRICDEDELDDQDFTNDKFVWTYTSPEYLMVQENRQQKFELPKPILCIGEILKVELLGRVQTQEMDGLYYICLNHVQVVVKLLSPVFDVETLNEQGKCLLKYSSVSSLKMRPAEALADSRSQSQLDWFAKVSVGW